MGRNVPGDHAARTNYAPFADVNAHQNNCTCGYPRASAYGDWSFDDRESRIGVVVGCGAEESPLGNRRVFFENDVCRVIDLSLVSYASGRMTNQFPWRPDFCRSINVASFSYPRPKAAQEK